MNTRDTILEQAFVLFASHGYAGVSLSQLLKACGIAKGGFYHHFHSKAEVFHESSEVYLGRVLAESLAYLKTHRDSVRSALGFISTYCTLLQDIRDGFSLKHLPGLYALVLSDGVPEGDRHPRSTYIHWRDAVITELNTAFRNGKERGEIDGDVDESELARHVLHSLEGAVLEWSLGSATDIIGLAKAEQDYLSRSLHLSSSEPSSRSGLLHAASQTLKRSDS